ncbi:MAG: CDP-alcohol phosphatidyltransferase family protein [Alphaproteobacteria bacterium]
MFDVELRRLVDPPLDRAGRALARAGLRPNAVTIAGFAVGLGCVPAIALQLWWLALVCLAVNRLCDGLDGAIARHGLATDFGGYLDIVCDFVFYAAFAFSFALARPDFAIPAGVLVLSFVGTGSSFLAHAIIAEKRGINIGRPAGKSFFYARGLAEGGETIGFFTLCLLWPSAFVWLAYGFSLLCWATTGMRVAQAWRTFNPRGR